MSTAITKAIEDFQTKHAEIEETYAYVMKQLQQDMNTDSAQRIVDKLLSKQNAALLDIDIIQMQTSMGEVIEQLAQEKDDEMKQAVLTLRQTIADIDTTSVTKQQVDILEKYLAS